MTQKTSVMFKIEGVDGAEPRMVARGDLINVFAQMAESDLRMAHGDLLLEATSDGAYSDKSAGDLIRLLEIHTRAVNALHALIALRHTDELVEMFMRPRDE